MNNFRICVYAIAKNEEKFAVRWAQSMSEADEIVVLDTGSSDKTAELLSSFPKVRLFSESIVPWRFDTARNLSLEKVSDDIDYCVCTDLDEVFAPGWRVALEKALVSKPHKVSYRYVWAVGADGSEHTVFNIEKIHRRKGFRWTHPVHEVLTYDGEETPLTVFAEGVQLNHYPDAEKSREQYLGLLELSVKEEPYDDRNVHYLGREYMYHHKYSDAVKMLKYHLSLPSATWKDERCASMRYISRCCRALDDSDNELLWLLKACAEAPYLREPWIETAEYFYRKKNWYGTVTFVNKALEITGFSDTYISDISCRKEKPYDLLSVALYYLGDIKGAEKSAEKALEFAPTNERIIGNLNFFRNNVRK